MPTAFQKLAERTMKCCLNDDAYYALSPRGELAVIDGVNIKLYQAGE
jgi:hypothetical protein